MSVEIPLLIIIFIVALVYSMVGHGGASGYIAIMVMFSIPFISIKPVALLLNIVVSLMTFIMYFRAGHFKLRLFWPLIIASIPAAFAGGYLKINQLVVNNILAAALLFSCIRLLKRREQSNIRNISEKAPFYLLLLLGIVIGFLAGMLGIGGGIILSPLLILFRWTDVRGAAAISAPFILLNSISGLTAFTIAGGTMPHNIVSLAIVVFIGGLLGGLLGSRELSLYNLKVVLSLTIAFAAFKLISF